MGNAVSTRFHEQRDLEVQEGTQKSDLIDWKRHWSGVGFDDLGDLPQP